MVELPFAIGDDKVGSIGAAEGHFVTGADPLRYSVQFENLPAATAPAQDVVITDPLDPATMDLSTLSLGPIGFGDRQVIPPPGLSSFATDVDLRPEQDLLVRIEASLDVATSVLTWRFLSLDPETGEPPADPLSGFLPPNLNPPEGQGRVGQDVRLLQRRARPDQQRGGSASRRRRERDRRRLRGPGTSP